MRNPSLYTLILLSFTVFPMNGSLGEDVSNDEGTPLTVTIRPDYEPFEGIIRDGQGNPVPLLTPWAKCPKNQILSCEITTKFQNEENQTQAVIAEFAYEKQKSEWRSPALSLLMGRRYAGKPDYIILASLGIDPKLEPLNSYPRPDGQMYGSIWFGDSLSLADRLAGPIMLTKGGPSQIELLNGEEGIFKGF